MPKENIRHCYLMHQSCLDVHQIYINSEGNLERLVEVHNWLYQNKKHSVFFQYSERVGWYGLVHTHKDTRRISDGWSFESYHQANILSFGIYLQFSDYFDNEFPIWVAKDYPEYFGKVDGWGYFKLKTPS